MPIDKDVKGCTGMTIAVVIIFLAVIYIISFIFGPEIASWIRRLIN